MGRIDEKTDSEPKDEPLLSGQTVENGPRLLPSVEDDDEE